MKSNGIETIKLQTKNAQVGLIVNKGLIWILSLNTAKTEIHITIIIYG